MHRSPRERFRHGVAIEPLEADDHEAALARLGRTPGPVVIVADARSHRLDQEAHRLAGNGRKTLHPQYIMGLGEAGDALGDEAGIADLAKLHDEALEIVVVVLCLVVVMGLAVLDVVLAADA